MLDKHDGTWQADLGQHGREATRSATGAFYDMGPGAGDTGLRQADRLGMRCILRLTRAGGLKSPEKVKAVQCDKRQI